MDILEMVIITLQITNAVTKKRYEPNSDESIQNFIYYKDCRHKLNVPTEQPAPREIEVTVAPMRAPIQDECSCPQMCCNMCCFNGCGNRNQPFTSRQMQPLQNLQNLQQNLPTIMAPPAPPRQPQLPTQPNTPQKIRKKKVKPQPLLPPIGGRRDLGFTREHIKSLISSDDDIKKILKELVKVTMQKVDLLQMINARRKMPEKMPENSFNSYDEDD